jgi:hypothetical protein
VQQYDAKAHDKDIPVGEHSWARLILASDGWLSNA